MGYTGLKTKKENDNRVKGTKGNWSLVNKISSIARTISGTAAIPLALAPKSAQGVRNARNRTLSLNRQIRDINAIMNRKVKQRVKNRVFGRATGLAINLALPPTNNIVLRLVRAKIGSRMNRVIHGGKKSKKPRIRLFGNKITKKYEKLFDVRTSGNIFLMMQKTLEMGMQATAPRTAFSMTLKGMDDPVQFSPQNLAKSIFRLEPEIRPNKHIIARYTVTAGSSMPGLMVADKAPYVWVANYGGILFDPKTGENDKVYAPSFFAQKALKFVAKTYAPAIKKIAEVVDPHGLGSLSTKNILQIKENERAKMAYKIWLSEEGEGVKKNKDFLKGGQVKRNSKGQVIRGKTVDGKFVEDKRATELGLRRTIERKGKFGIKLTRTETVLRKDGKHVTGKRAKDMDMTYEGAKGATMGGYAGMPKKRYYEAAKSQAEATMEYLYGGKVFESKTTKRVKTGDYKRKKAEPKKSKARQKTERPRGKYKVQQVKGNTHTRTYKKNVDVGVSIPDVGQIPITADMRALKPSDRGRARYIAGKNNRYRESVLDTAEIRINEQNILSFGAIEMNAETKELLKYARSEGVIDFKFRGNVVTNAEIKDLKRFEDIFGVQYGSRKMYSLDGKYRADAETTKYGAVRKADEYLQQLKKEGKVKLTKAEQRRVERLSKVDEASVDVALPKMRVWNSETGTWEKTAGGNYRYTKKGINNIEGGRVTASFDPNTGKVRIKSNLTNQINEIKQQAFELRQAGIKAHRKLEKLEKQLSDLGIQSTGAFTKEAVLEGQITNAIESKGFKNGILYQTRKGKYSDDEILKDPTLRYKEKDTFEALFDLEGNIITEANYKSVLANLSGRSGGNAARIAAVEDQIDKQVKILDEVSQRLFGMQYVGRTAGRGLTPANRIDIDDIKGLFKGNTYVATDFSPTNNTLADFLNFSTDAIDEIERGVKAKAVRSLKAKKERTLYDKAESKGFFDQFYNDTDIFVGATASRLTAVANQAGTGKSVRKSAKGLVNLTFKVDPSQQMRLRSRGAGGYLIEVRQPKLRGVNEKRDLRTDKRRTITASDVKINQKSLTFTFNDDLLPTEFLHLNVALRDGRITKGGINLRTKDGKPLQNVTRTTNSGIVFVDEGGGKLRMAKLNENVAPERRRTYGINTAHSGRPQFSKNEVTVLDNFDAQQSLLDYALDQRGPISDIALLKAVMEDKGQRRKSKSEDFKGYSVGGSSQGYIIRFEDL